MLSSGYVDPFFWWDNFLYPVAVRRPHRIARRLEKWAVLRGLLLGELISCGLSSREPTSSHGLIPCPLVPRGLVSRGLVSRGLLPQGHTDSIPYLVAASPRSPCLLLCGHLSSAPLHLLISFS